MKNQRKAWLAAGLLALGAAACFSDPTSDLRSGPVAITTSYTAVSVVAGDSIDVKGIVVDAQGNPLPVGPVTWTSADPTIAAVNADTANPAPGDIFTRAFVRGESNLAGITTVTVTAQGITASVRVTVVPKTFPGAVSVSGTPSLDTVIINRPAPATPLVVEFTAGDTLVLNSTATVTFSATTSTVSFGAFPGYIIARSATQIKALARQPYGGKVTVTNLTYAGDATTGPIAIPSLQTDSIAIQKARFRGTLAVVGDTLTLTAAPNTTFSAAGSDTSTVSMQGTRAMIFSRNATTIRAIAPIVPNPTYTGGLVVNNINITAPAVKLDSVTSTTNVAMNRASIVASISGDTLIVAAPTPGVFITAATNQSNVIFGANAGSVFVRTAAQMKSLSLNTYNGPVTIRNVTLGTGRIDSLKTTGTLAIAAASFPFNITQTGGNMLDTVTIATQTLGAGPKFSIAGTASQIQLNGQNALVIRRTLDTMKVVSILGSSGKLTVTNVTAGSVTFASLQSPNTVTLSSTVTGEVNEPGNNLGTGATTLVMAAIGDSVQPIGAMNGSADTQDHYQFVMPAAGGTVSVRLDFFGDGSGASDLLPDFDVVVCTSLQATGSTAGQCRYNQDLIPGNGGSLTNQPEAGTTPTIPGGTTVYVRTYAYFATGGGFGAYRLTIKTQ